MAVQVVVPSGQQAMMFLQTGPELLSLIEARMFNSSIRLVLAQGELELPKTPFRRPPARRLPRIPSALVSSSELQQEISPTLHWDLAWSRAAESDSLAATATPTVRAKAAIPANFIVARSVLGNVLRAGVWEFNLCLGWTTGE